MAAGLLATPEIADTQPVLSVGTTDVVLALASGVLLIWAFARLKP